MPSFTFPIQTQFQMLIRIPHRGAEYEVAHRVIGYLRELSLPTNAELDRVASFFVEPPGRVMVPQRMELVFSVLHPDMLREGVANLMPMPFSIPQPSPEMVAMAMAVLQGDQVAALQLADRVLEAYHAEVHP